MTQDSIPIRSQQLAYFRSRQPLFAQVAGGWPPSISDPTQLAEVRQMLLEDIARVEHYLGQHADCPDGREILGDFLRMAHNLDVPDCAQRAETVLLDLVAECPDRASTALALASLYVTLHKDLAPKAEHHFRRALALQGEQADPLIHQGIGFACLYQDKRAEAMESFRRYLLRVPSDQRIATLLQRLEHERGEVAHVHVPMKAKGDVVPDRRPWWKLW